MHEAEFVVSVVGGEIVSERPGGIVERVALRDLRAVIVETNDSGPWGADVWWLLVGAGLRSGCVFPQGATGEDAVLAVLQQLPGFDNQALIEAMGCTENRRLLCWQAAPDAGP